MNGKTKLILLIFNCQVWFSNRRAKWRREEKLRNQRRTPSSSVSSTAGGGTNAGNVTPTNLSGLGSNVNGSTHPGNQTPNGNNHANSNSSDPLQSGGSGLLGSSNYLHISSLSPPRLNLNNGFGSAMSTMYPSIHPSMQMSDSYRFVFLFSFLILHSFDSFYSLI